MPSVRLNKITKEGEKISIVTVNMSPTLTILASRTRCQLLLFVSRLSCFSYLAMGLKRSSINECRRAKTDSLENTCFPWWLRLILFLVLGLRVFRSVSRVQYSPRRMSCFFLRFDIFLIGCIKFKSPGLYCGKQ